MTQLFILAMLLLVSGMAILITAFIPIRQLMTALPVGTIRSRWYLLAGLNLVFILGYGVYGAYFWNQIKGVPDLIIPVVFFLGAIFVRLISSMSLQTAKDIRRVILLEKENITDPLTGLFNRRYLDRRLEEEYIHACRYDLPLSILMIDIDYFKRVNDTYGHPVGDILLKELSKVILDFIRGSDILARYGGEEFVIIILNTPPESAAHFAERVVKHIEAHPFIVTYGSYNEIEIKMNVSIGVAGLCEGVNDYQTLFQNADEALYAAKTDGRNRVGLYSKLPLPETTWQNSTKQHGDRI